MQSHRIRLDYWNSSARLFAAGAYFKYVTSGGNMTNKQIRVQSEGLDVLMMPGNSVRVSKPVNDWRISGSPTFFSDLLVADLVVGNGELVNDSLTLNSLEITSFKESDIMSNRVWVTDWVFSSGNPFTYNMGNVHQASFYNAGAAAAVIDVYAFNKAVLPTNTTVARTPIYLSGFDSTDTDTLRAATVDPATMAFIDRVSIPAAGGARIDWRLAPNNCLYFKLRSGTAASVGMSLVGSIF